jgi:hypothetical protein
MSMNSDTSGKLVRVVTPSVMTAERFGRVPRHYFRALKDRVIPIAAQDFMISA